jgi:hypothetical protein
MGAAVLLPGAVAVGPVQAEATGEKKMVPTRKPRISWNGEMTKRFIDGIIMHVQ